MGLAQPEDAKILVLYLIVGLVLVWLLVETGPRFLGLIRDFLIR